MQIKRRDAFKLAGGAAFAALGLPGFAAVKPIKVLILGGTGFIGPHFVKALTDGGHRITLFNRGKRDPEVHPGIEQLLGDRDGQVEALKGRDWDVCIDNSGYKPSQVKLTTALLKGHAGQYIFISSIAVYANFAKAGIDEDYKLAALKDPSTEDVTGETYGGLKVLCEKAVGDVYGESATIIRPTYIAGPGDPTDRFTYWPWRVSKGGEMLAPGTPSDPFQYIDVRDLADFIRLCAEKANTTFVWAKPAFLTEHKVIGEGATGNLLPIWVPPQGDEAGLLLVSPARAIKKGLKFRSLETTIRQTLEWQKSRPEDKQTLKAGLPMEMEAKLLAKLRAA
jgi:2'-hydroxyisoflavone reductase